MTVPHVLNAHRRDSKNRATITLTGEIDLDSASLLRTCLAQCLRDGIRTIDVDLTTVTFCDCTGLNTFLTASILTAAVGGSLQLRYPSPSVSRLFELTDSGTFLLAPHDNPTRPYDQAARAA
jgi:anti-sigma B factor antagonist